MTRLGWQLAVAAAGLALVAAALTSFAATAVVVEVPDYGGTYVEGIAGFPQALNPLLANDDASRGINALVFAGLTKTDDRGQTQPDLAARWEISPDGKTYTFYLNADAKWHDGRPVTADDVVYTIETLRDPSYNRPLGGLWRDVSLRQLDGQTVEFRLERDTFAPFLEYTSVGLLPHHLLAGVGPRELETHRFNGRPVGTGPFRVKEVKPDYLLVERAPTYHGPRPYLDRIKFRIYPNHKTILTGLERDEVEGVSYVDPEDAPRLRGSRKVEVYHGPLTSFTALFLNLSHPVLGDPAVRRALAHGLDRERLIEVARAAGARPADTPILPDSWAHNPDLTRYSFDPARAREIMEAAGWATDGGPVRSKEDRALRFVLLTNDRRERVRVAEEIQRQLAAIGIEVEVQATGAGGLVQDFLLPRRFEAALYSWDFRGYDPDPYPLWHSSQIAPRGLNISGLNRREIDEVLDRARRATDRDERARLYRRFQELFAEELPSVLLYYPTYTYAVSPKIRGVRIGLLADSADRFRNVTEWYAKTRREVAARR